MERSRLRKSYLNTLSLIACELISFVVSLILPRLIISTYGSAYNGMIASITQFLGVVSILNLGVAGATRVALYKSLADCDTVKTSGIVKATEQHMHRIGYVVLVYIAVLIAVYPYILRGEYTYGEVAFLVVAIGIGTFAQYFFGITYQTLLAADQKLYVYNVVQAISVITNCVLSVVLILMGFSVQLMKLITAIIFLVKPIFLNYYVSRKYNIIKKCKPDTSALAQRGSVIGHSIANIVHENTDIIVLTVFSNVSLVSVYSVYNLVMAGLRQVLNIFTYSAEAVLGNMWAKNEHTTIRRNFSYFEYMVSAFVSIIFPCTFVLILPFVSLYVKDIADVEYVLPLYAFVITLAQLFFFLRTPYLSMVQAAGHYKETKNGAYFEAVINFLLSVMLVPFMGIVGPAIGTLIANVFRTFQYAAYVSKYLVKGSRWNVVNRLLWLAMNNVVSILFCYPITVKLATLGWSYWTLCGAVCLLISTGCCALSSWLFYKNDFIGLLGLAMRIIRRK